ncbi:hypothetical protein [Haladaptatus salinisoli]|uniref:hypothetical protein n=1 Tax=Haladaptatus salinisoli TaxID=2884876 RepID=UPI001D09A00E|nr:hypothetical protein [Haladaptatus salinisoli]
MTTESNESEETLLAHLSGWFRQRPTSMEYWDLLVTDERAIWCFVGESFKSMLLRADTGERGRREIAAGTPERALTLSERNFAVPLDSLGSIHVREGSRFRRESAIVTWREDGEPTSFELYRTKSSDSKVGDIESLRNDSRLSHVDIDIETRGLF